MQFHYDPYDPQVLADPYPVYRHLRAHAPVYRNDEVDFWALSRHADVAVALRDNKRFSNANGTILEPGAWGPQARLFESLLAMDPPDHTRTRSLVAVCFTRRRVAALEPLARQVVGLHLDPLLGCPEFDLVSDFADPLPGDLLSAVIGVPESDRPQVGKLARLAAQCDNPGSDISAPRIEAALELVGHYAILVAERRRQRRDDLLSEVVHTSVAGDQFSDAEIVQFLNAITSAANDTVGHLIGNAWYWAWRNPAQKDFALAGEVQKWIDSAAQPKDETAQSRRRFGVFAHRSANFVLAMVGFHIFAAGCMSVTVVAIATSHHEKSLSGVLLGVISVGVIIGGLAFGGRKWPGSTRAQLVGSYGATAVVLVVAIPVPGIPALAVLLVLIGLIGGAIDTLLQIALGSAVPARYQAEAFAWLTTVMWAASGIGTAVGGHLVSGRAAGGATALLAAAAATAVAALWALGVPRRDITATSNGQAPVASAVVPDPDRRIRAEDASAGIRHDRDKETGTGT